MKIAIMQPYFMPYLGYFQVMAAVDIYVVYDDVQYIKGGWVSRNNILMDGEKKLFSIRLQGASPNKTFREIEVSDDFRKFLTMLRLNYHKAPYFPEVMPMMERICLYPDNNLVRFFVNSYHEILTFLGIDTKLVLSSELNKNCSLHGQDKVLDICRVLDATEYLNAIGGQELYDRDTFAEKGVRLGFVKTDELEYLQFGGQFVPDLSIIDVLMFNGKDGTLKLLNEYSVI